MSARKFAKGFTEVFVPDSWHAAGQAAGFFALISTGVGFLFLLAYLILRLALSMGWVA